MVARILAFGTALPPRRLTQAELRDYFAGQPGTDRRTARLIGAAFDGSGIAHRHTVLTEFGGGEVDPPRALHPPAHRDTAFFAPDGTLQYPTTGVRNDRYRAEAPALFAAAAREALTRAHLPPEAVTHVITVSCTGSFAPGPDYRLVRDLGLTPTVARTHIGFMGCAAAFPALRQSRDTCLAHPDAVVLVVCAELCSLHLRASSDPEQIVSSAVFADGAAACIVVGNDAPLNADRAPAPALAELVHFATALTSTGEDDMDWSVGDHGFDMRLTANVPRIIGAEISGAVDRLLGGVRAADGGMQGAAPNSAALQRADIAAWAVHPGGRAVLDRVETGLELDAQALADSRAVLRAHGNMSSATILFVLARMLDDSDSDNSGTGEARAAALRPGQHIGALCFGPGLTVEGAVLTVGAGDA